MTSSYTEQPAVGRLPYEKPTVRSISLVADQVLGINCKTNTPLASNSIGAAELTCLAKGCAIQMGS